MQGHGSQFLDDHNLLNYKTYVDKQYKSISGEHFTVAKTGFCQRNCHWKNMEIKLVQLTPRYNNNNKKKPMKQSFNMFKGSQYNKFLT